MKAHPQLVAKDVFGPDELAGLRLLANADFDAIGGLLEQCPVHMLHKNDVLFKPGMRNDTLYLVLQGRLRVHLDSAETRAAQFIDVGDAVGELSLVDEKPTTAFVIADVDSSLLAISQETFWSLVNASHAVARNMLVMVVERMRANNALAVDGVRLREQNSRESNVDQLTGLRNGATLVGLLRRQLLRSSMNRKPLTVMAVDIDGFRDYNNDFGRSGGDHALCAVAQTLVDQLRPTDIVTRLQGDRFGVILPECDEDGARVVAERLREAIAEAMVVMADQSILPSVTVSTGIAQMKSFEPAEQLIEAAESALKRAKEAGGNCCSV